MEQRIKEKEQAANTVDIDKFPDSTSATMQRSVTVSCPSLPHPLSSIVTPTRLPFSQIKDIEVQGGRPCAG